MSLTHTCEGSGRPVVELDDGTEATVRDAVIAGIAKHKDRDEIIAGIIFDMTRTEDLEYGEDEMIAEAVDSWLVHLGAAK